MRPKAIDGATCEKAWIDSGRDPRQLAEFLEAYPAANFLSWVKDARARWQAHGERETLKLLDTGGKRKPRDEGDSGLSKAFRDFLIYEAVEVKKKEGYHTSGSKDRESAFAALADKPFAGKYFSEGTIRRRYYDFLNRKAAAFIDKNGAIHCGPVKISLGENDLLGVGFWTWEPDR